MALIKVIATRQGYFGGQIRPEGAVFHIKSKEQMGSWMNEYKKPKKKEVKPAEPVDDTGPTEDELHEQHIEKISNALDELDHDNDEHWDEDGLPALDALEGIMEETGLQRADVSEANVGFERTVSDDDTGGDDEVI